MRLVLPIAALAAALLLSSCSDDPVGPGGSGPPVATDYRASFDFFLSSTYYLWGDGVGNVYASGSSILRYDGRSWEAITVPPAARYLNGTWGANGDIYALGDQVYRLHNEEWSTIDVPERVVDLQGASNGELFAYDFDRKLLHFDGSGWEQDSVDVQYPWGWVWNGIAVGSEDDVFMLGRGGWLTHFDGADWTAARIDTTIDLWKGWKSPDGPLYMIGPGQLLTYSESVLDTVDLGGPVDLSGVCGQSASEVYCFGRDYDTNTYSLFRYDGVHWARTLDTTQRIDGVWKDNATNRTYVVSERTVAEVRGGSLQPLLGTTRSSNYGFLDVWGSPEAGLYAVGDRAYRYESGSWVDLEKQKLTLYPAYSIWGRSEHELYAVGGSMILHYDGDTWTWVSGAGEESLRAVSGNDRDVFAVGARGTILRYDGVAWTKMNSGTSYSLFGVYAWANGAFAVGESGVLMRYDGREWHPAPSPVGWTMYDIFGLGPDRIFAVGENASEICVYDGHTWTSNFIGHVNGYYNQAVWGTSSSNLFVVHDRGEVFHFDGSAWSLLPRIGTDNLRSVWGTPDGDILTAGGAGLIRYSR